MSKQVDVLSELDRRIEIGELFGQEHDAPNLPGVASLREARAAVAELIEADAEFDAALAAYASAEADGDDDLICNAVRQLQWAKDRRATAFARCNGGAA